MKLTQREKDIILKVFKNSVLDKLVQYKDEKNEKGNPSQASKNYKEYTMLIDKLLKL